VINWVAAISSRTFCLDTDAGMELIFNSDRGECVYRLPDSLDRRFSFDTSDMPVCGLLELTANVMHFGRIR
jgi:hypothetical protein